MRSCLAVIWLVVALAMAAGCRPSRPAEGMDPGMPDRSTVETTPIDATPTLKPSTGAAPTASPTAGLPAVPADAQGLVDLAKADLSRELVTKADNITLLSVEETDFPDTSLGVPEPGKMYAQVITPGYIIRLGVGDKVYTYHGSGERIISAPDDSE